MMAVNIPNYRCVVAPYFSFRDSAARPLISRILRQPSCHQRLLGNSGNSKARRANAAKARSRSSYCYPIRRFFFFALFQFVTCTCATQLAQTQSRQLFAFCPDAVSTNTKFCISSLCPGRFRHASNFDSSLCR